MPLRHKHQREHANPRANPAKTAPGHVRNDHAAPPGASAEGNAGRRLPEGQSTRPQLPPGTTRSSAAAGCPASAPPVATRSGACPWTSLRRGATDKRWRPYREFLCPAFDGHEISSASAESAGRLWRRTFLATLRNKPSSGEARTQPPICTGRFQDRPTAEVAHKCQVWRVTSSAGAARRSLPLNRIGQGHELPRWRLEECLEFR